VNRPYWERRSSIRMIGFSSISNILKKLFLILVPSSIPIRGVGVVERFPYPEGFLRNVIQCLEDYDIPLYLSSTVVEVKGNGRLEEVVAKVDENFKPIPGTEKSFKVDTLILSVGLIPNVELLEDVVEIDRTSKGFSVSNLGQTSLDFVFAAGNCTIIYDLVDYVTIEGEKAEKYTSLYVKGEKFSTKIPIKKGENIGFNPIH